MRCSKAFTGLVLAPILSLGAALGSELQVGFADLQLSSSGATPAGAALFQLVNEEGVLVSEAGVGAAQLLHRGRLFVQQTDSLRTGVALANPLDQVVHLRLVLRDREGSVSATIDSLVLQPYEHRARFVDELFPAAPVAFTGSLTFEGLTNGDRVTAVTLRQNMNEYGEPLFTTLPVADLEDSESPGQDLILFPQVGAGPGLSTQLLLINRSHSRTRGKVVMTASNGSTLLLDSGTETGSEFAFALAPDGVQFWEFASPVNTALAVGYASVEVTEGPLPAGTAVFRYFSPQGPVSEAGVGSIPLTRKARIFIDTDRTFTGLAAANPGNVDALVTYRLLDGNGFPIEVLEQPLPARQHVAKFAGELFDLPARFTGLLEIESDVDLVPITLKLSVNARGDSILTTLPIADLTHPDNSSRVTFPQVGSGSAEGVGEFSTRLIFIERTGAAAAEGQLRFWKGQGDPLRLDRIAASVDFAVEVGAAGEVNFTDLPPPPEVSRGRKTSKQVGPEGGLLLLEDDLENFLLLEIPAFALEEPVTITMTALTEKPARSLGQNLFPGVVLEPEGLILQEPARLTVLLSNPLLHPDRTALLYVDPYGSHRPVPKPLAAGQVVEGDISHFSPFTIGESNLTDLLAAAHSIYAQTDSVLKERLRRYYENEYGAQFPDELLQILVRLDDIKTLELYNGSLEALGQAASPGFKGFVEETVLEILSGSLPSDPCGLYQVALNYLLRLVPILNDPALEASFRSRLAQVDTKCISDSLAGDWLEESNTQNETCSFGTVGGGFEWDEEDETGLNPFRIEQNGSRLEIRYTSIPSSPTFHGEVRKTTSASNPYRVTASYDGSGSLDCLTFFSSGGHGLDFGAPLCYEDEDCTPLSCSESQLVGASVQFGGSRLVGVESWTFAASVRVNPPNEAAYVRSVSCRGGGPFSAVKTH